MILSLFKIQTDLMEKQQQARPQAHTALTVIAM